MRTKHFIILSIAIISLIVAGFTWQNMIPINDPISFPKGKKYEKEWQAIDSLEGKGLPKSALEIGEKVFEDAQKHENPDQMLKALFYKMKYINSIEENAFESLINKMEEEAPEAIFPARQVMHSMLAEMYWMYYQNNRWKFMERTETVNFKNDDMQTWTLNKLADKVIEHYKKSLSSVDSLQRTPVILFDEVINKGNQVEPVRPTLYDFLAYRAIDFFSNSEISVTRPADKFTLKEDFYFGDAELFANQEITTSDTMSLHFYAIEVLQDLIKFRLKTPNKTALIAADIRRLQVVNNHSVSDIKDSLYFNAISSLETKYNDIPYSAEVSYLIAQYYRSKASKYNALQESTFKYKWLNKNAKEKCEAVITKYPKARAAEKCKNMLAEITRRNLYASLEQFIPKGEVFSTQISFQNLDKAWIRVARMDRDKIEKMKKKLYSYELYDRLIKEAETVSETQIELPDDKDFNQHAFDYLLEGLPVGYYVLFIANNPEFSYAKNLTSFTQFSVTNISYIQRQTNDGKVEFYVLDRDSGHPIENVIAQIYFSEYDYKAREYKKVKGPVHTTNAEGYFNVDNSDRENSKNFYVEFFNGDDYLNTNRSYYAYNYRSEPKPHYNTYYFTDRSIYRPGQTVYFKGIVIKSDGDERNIVPEYGAEVRLHDVNSQKVESLLLTTNEYGTFNGSFTIPQGLLNGTMSIRSQHGNVYFSVEDYKRPKFEVEMLPFDGNYMLNDSISVKGKAESYSGAKITDAKVTYRVVRTPVWRGWWWYDMDRSETEIASGESSTDDRGEYEINFKAIPDLSLKKSTKLSFNYAIYVDVTDINGETRSTSKNISVGYTALTVNLQINSKLDQDNPGDIKVITRNLNGEDVAAKGDIKIYKLNSPETALRSRKGNYSSRIDKFIYSDEEWNSKFPGNEFKDENNIRKMEKGKNVFTTVFDTEKEAELVIKELDKWPPGLYVAEVSSKDAFGNDVDNQIHFTVFSQKQKQMPYATINWFKPLKIYTEPGETAEFLIGSSLENVKVLYEIEHKNKIVEKKWIDLSNEQQLLKIPVKEEHRGNFAVHFTFVKDNRYYTQNSVVYVPYTNKQLDIEFETFRNKLYPGQDEEWRIIVKGKNGDKVAAEMLATLYDASLDQFKSHYWYFNIWNSYYSNSYWRSDGFNIVNASVLKKGFDEYYTMPRDYHETLNWFGFSYYSNYYYWDNGEGIDYMMSESEADEAMPITDGERSEVPSNNVRRNKGLGMAETAVASPASVALDEPAPAPPSLEPRESSEENNAAGGEDMSKVKARTNFNETAFFYPNLKTNEKGEVIIKFTIPEALTKWKMLGFAHTKDLKYSVVTNELITQKDLMVNPNPPRFFRENDEIEFPVKISNVSKKDLDGLAQLEFFDAITMQPVEGIMMKGEAKQKEFSVKAGLNALVTWKLKIPETVQAVTYRIVAKAGSFSDGEENVLPVLTNRMLVTESLPLPIRGKQTKQFEFTKLINSKNSNTLKHQKLTLEFTSNPAWYAVQALPYLMEYPYECYEQTFSRYYANSLASHIANSNPKIKRVFDAWRNTPESKALLSNLEKNQELKALLLEETPWVMNAQNESARKRRVGLLFDLNKMSSELNRAMKKLVDGQVSNGGWPWFDGMPDDRYITQHIVSGLGHLDKLGVENVRNDSKVWNMLQKAVKYIDNRMREDYDWLKKHYTDKELKEKHISYLQIHYLYARSNFTDLKVDGKNKEAFDYYIGQAEKYWLNESKYMQGMIGLALHRFEKKGTPQDIIKSLKEHSISDEEMGMYWKSSYGFSWYDAPIERQALMIELFDEVAQDLKAVDDLKVWMLKQKQTQDWRTTKATVEAVYALLKRGADWLDSDELVSVKLGDITVDPKKMDDVQVEAGTGYYKTSWNKGEIKPEMGKISVTKNDEGVAWGAIYWQYFEQLDKITPHETPLKLDKKLFIEKNTANGKVLDPITEKNKLNVGDKVIVRIELRVDRSMDYVHMKDMRAAGFEPVNVISSYKYQDGLGYYESTRDAATNFFISHLRKGTYVFEYALRVSHKGDFSNGITNIQCMYAPEFASHSEGIRVKVE